MNDYEVMPEPPPLDYTQFEAPPDDDGFSYLPEEDWLPLVDPDDIQPDLRLTVPDFDPVEPPAQVWDWYDARLIGVERETDSGTRYEIGAVDLYTHLPTGEISGSYLPLADFDTPEPAESYYHDRRGQIHDRGLRADEIPDFIEQLAEGPPAWQALTGVEYAAYDRLRSLESGEPDDRDLPPEAALESLRRTADRLSGVELEPETAYPPGIADAAAFQALDAIGLDATNFDPTHDPPPFYDADTGTAYWIGVFQPDRDDPANCITSILSLGRNPDSGEVEAQLAPCVPGDWDKAYSAAAYLIAVAQKGGIDRCFDAAEGMALATDQRQFWEAGRGIALEPDAAQDIAAYTREAWEVAL